MITVKIDNIIEKTKSFKTTCFGAYEFAIVRIDGWWYKVRRRIDNPAFVFYSNLKNQDKKYLK